MGKMKKIGKRTCFFLGILGILGILFIFWAIRNIQYGEKGEIDSAAVCTKNGDVAFSYYGSHPVIALYDKDGNKCFAITVDDWGGIIQHMWFDDDGYLHVYLGRKDVERVYDRDGKRVSQTQPESVSFKPWDGWEKQGLSYRNNYEGTTYVYEYQNELECLFYQKTYFMIQKPDGTTVQIWTAGKH